MAESDPGGGDLTRMLVLAVLGRDGPTSRAAIARELDVSAARVSQVTRQLIKQGVVEPLYCAPSEGGRPGLLLGLVADAGRAIGVKVATDHLILVNVRLDGRVMETRIESFDALARDATAKLAAVLLAFRDAGDDRLLGVGISVPGVVAHPDVGSVDATVFGSDAVPLGTKLREVVGAPVLVENDAKALAVAERLYGRGRNRLNFVLVTIGRGVGFASVADGILKRGARGGAGELAHVVISNGGLPCACGQRGCLESYVGANGLVAAGMAAGVLRQGEGLACLVEIADRGDPRARGVFAGAGQRLAHAIAPALAALDPEAILIASEGTTAWRHWDSAFRNGLAKRLPSWMASTPIEVADWDESSWARGAAAIVLATPFDRHALAGRQRSRVLARLYRVSDHAPVAIS